MDERCASSPKETYGAVGAVLQVENSFSSPGDLSLRIMLTLHGVEIVEMPFEGAGGFGEVYGPNFLAHDGTLVDIPDGEIGEALLRFARDQLDSMGWDWNDGVGGCGTILVDVQSATFEIDAYERKLIVQARPTSGSLPISE